MNLDQMCINCMQGTIVNGICNKCGKQADYEKDRPIYALPTRFTLCRQYYIGRVLGSGGFGITYLAWDTKYKRRVAVKELFMNTDMTRVSNTSMIQINKGQESYVEHIRQRFLEEAQALYEFSRVQDIINVYHLFQENGTAYYAMEFLEGCDLKSLLKNNGKLSWEQLSVYVRMILRALNALHGRALIHRDISPDNIFLTKDGRAKLIDFGSLRAYNSGRNLTTILKQRFAPYEQYRSDGKQGPWTDIYSLSITMYYSLSGTLAPKAPDRILADNTVPITELVPNLPANVAAAIWKGMAVAPEARYQNVSDFYAALFPGEQLQPANAQGQPQTVMPHVNYNGQHSPQGQVNQAAYPNAQGQARQAVYPNAQGQVNKAAYPNAQGQVNQAVYPNAQGQVRQTGYQNPATNVSGDFKRIFCVAGYYAGKTWTISAGATIRLGRDKTCQIIYPTNTPGISRAQCTFAYQGNGYFYLRDENSSYGTFINGTRINPGAWYQIREDSVVSFGQESYQVR